MVKKKSVPFPASVVYRNVEVPRQPKWWETALQVVGAVTLVGASAFSLVWLAASTYDTVTKVWELNGRVSALESVHGWNPIMQHDTCTTTYMADGHSLVSCGPGR